MSGRVRKALVGALVLAAAAGCASAPSSSSTSTITPGTTAACSVQQAASGDSSAAVHGSIRVLAAASLDEAFDALSTRFEREHPGTHVELSSGPSSGLVAQLHQGSPADVIATADTVTMHRAVAAGDVDRPVTFACNRLAILVRKGNPEHVASLADLSHVDFVLCAAPVPCGRLGREALARAGVTAEPIGSEKDVSTVVAKVEQGEVDAGIVYVTDAEAARGKADSVTIAPEHNVVTAYPIAVASNAANDLTARAFEAFVTSPAGQAILSRYGFTRS